MTRCKVGDLAIITWTETQSANIGKIVEVIRREDFNENYDNDGDPSWLVRGRDLLIVYLDDDSIELTRERVISDICLTPICGLPLADEIRSDLKITEPA